MRVLCLILLCVTPSPAQFRPERRYALTAGAVVQSIVKALAQQGVRIAGEQVSIFSDVLSKEPEPVLDVIVMEHSGPTESNVRLACHTPGSCVPFYASIRGRTGEETVSIAPRLRAKAVLLKLGAKATMWMGNERMHISLEVVTLESGAAGQVIRVASADRRHIYRAEVVSATVVRGRFS